MSNIRLEFHNDDPGVLFVRQQAATKIREQFSALLTTIEEILPPSRERSVVATKLQEACMWATKGVALYVRDPREG